MRRILVVLAIASLLAALPTAAQAKGASAATISGGSMDPITLKGEGEPGSGTELANLADQAGVWALLFEDGPGGELAVAPAGQRGPRYEIAWIFPNGQGTEDTVRQSVWPYAAGGPLTYMASGQPVLDATTKGGWFRATDTLRQTLVSLGLPDRKPVAAPAASSPPPAPAPVPAPADPAPAVWPRVAVGVGLLLVVAATAVLVLRRRSGPATAP
jgi:hypothetical protein